MLSVLSFYTVTAIAAWLPLVLLAGQDGRPARMGPRSLCLGLCLLSGDPVLALGAVPLLLICVRYHGWRRGLLHDAVAIAIGGCLALPQLVATARLAPGTYRFGHGLPEASVRDFGAASGALSRIARAVPLRLPHFLGAHGSWATSVMSQTPLYLSLYFGITALVLALFACRRRPELSLLALAG